MLNNIVQNKVGKESSKSAKNNQEDGDFEFDITFDNLADEISSKSPHKGNIQSVQLAAKMVSRSNYMYACTSTLCVII